MQKSAPTAQVVGQFDFKPHPNARAMLKRRQFFRIDRVAQETGSHNV